jgi:hypothetical protein
MLVLVYLHNKGKTMKIRMEETIVDAKDADKIISSGSVKVKLDINEVAEIVAAEMTRRGFRLQCLPRVSSHTEGQYEETMTIFDGMEFDIPLKELSNFVERSKS